MYMQIAKYINCFFKKSQAAPGIKGTLYLESVEIKLKELSKNFCLLPEYISLICGLLKITLIIFVYIDI